MIQVDADILLIDEVLAVGDAAFQQKCFDAFQRMKDAGKTILFVTHDMGAVQRFCDRAMLIDRGRVEMIGAPDEVGTRYLERNFGREVAAPAMVTDGEDRAGDRSAEIVEAWFEQGGARTDVLPQGQPCALTLRVRFNAPLRDPIIAFLIENERHDPLWALSNEDGGAMTGSHEAGEEATFTVTFTNVFAPGRIYLTPWMLHNGGAPIIDRRPRLQSAVVTAVHRSGGAVDLPHEMRYERGVRTSA
jgi:ABC-type multidrug transport system ATPase subunit